MPSIDVVVPCFNQANVLNECLSSLIAQTFEDWRAVVVDDASTIGDVAGVVEAFGDPRIEWIRLDRNHGLAAARNTGIRAGTAEFVVPVDSDDALEPHFLEELRRVLQTDADADCVFPDFTLFGGATGRIRWGDGEVGDLVARQWLPGPGCMYRRQLWDRVGGYCEAARLRAGNEDWDFYLSAAEAGFSPRHLDKVLYRYRITPTSMGMRLRYVNFETREFIAARHRGLFERYGGRRAFLAEGYVVSAKASLERAERRRALMLALQALLLNRHASGAPAVLLRSLVPGPVLATLRDMKQRRRTG